MVGQRAKEIDWEEEEEKKKRRRITANMSIISNQEWDAGSSREMISWGDLAEQMEGRNSQGDRHVLQKTLNEWVRTVKHTSLQ